MVTKEDRHLLFAVVTQPICCHAMCLKVGDENIVCHPMCVKNRRQTKFSWEKEWDYGDVTKALLIIFSSDESTMSSLYVYEGGWRKPSASPYVCEK